jgi:hypothetical protein
LTHTASLRSRSSSSASGGGLRTHRVASRRNACKRGDEPATLAARHALTDPRRTGPAKSVSTAACTSPHAGRAPQPPARLAGPPLRGSTRMSAEVEGPRVSLHPRSLKQHRASLRTTVVVNRSGECCMRRAARDWLRSCVRTASLLYAPEHNLDGPPVAQMRNPAWRRVRDRARPPWPAGRDLRTENRWRLGTSCRRSGLPSP